jgi:hypothetical protein
MKLKQMPFVLGCIATSVITITAACGGTSNTPTGNGRTCDNTTYTPNYASDTDVVLKRWPGLPIKVYFETNNTVRDATTIEDLTREGFDDWETRMGVNFWQEVTDREFADMTVRVSTVAPQNTLGITTVYFLQGSSILEEAEMVIYNWASLPTDEFAPTAAHEMGHALGISGHSSNNQDIMFFTGNASGMLTTADQNTIRTSYCNFGSSSALTTRSRTPRELLQSETTICPVKH